MCVYMYMFRCVYVCVYLLCVCLSLPLSVSVFLCLCVCVCVSVCVPMRLGTGCARGEKHVRGGWCEGRLTERCLCLCERGPKSGTPARGPRGLGPEGVVLIRFCAWV